MGHSKSWSPSQVRQRRQQDSRKDMGQGQAKDWGRPTEVSWRRRAEHCRPAARSLWGFQATESALGEAEQSQVSGSSSSYPARGSSRPPVVGSHPHPSNQKEFPCLPSQSKSTIPSPVCILAPSSLHPILSSLLHDYSEDQGFEGWGSGRKEPYTPLDPIQKMPVCLRQQDAPSPGSLWSRRNNVGLGFSSAHPTHKIQIALTSTCNHSP